MAGPDADWHFTLHDDLSDTEEDAEAWFDEDDDEMYKGEEADEDDYEDSPEEEQAARDTLEDLPAHGQPSASGTQQLEQSATHADQQQPSQHRRAYGRTMRFLAALEGLSHVDIQHRMGLVIDYMASLGFDIATFLHFLTYRLPDVTTEQRITYARASLIHGGLLVGILDNLYCPPRKRGARRPKGARHIMEPWHVEKTKRSINKEMRALKPVFESPLSELSEEMLLSVKMRDLIKTVKRRSPTFWELLFDSSTTPRQRTRNTYKDPEPVSLHGSTCPLSYSNDHIDSPS